MEYSVDTVNLILPPHKVPSQLNILTPVGIPMMKLVSENAVFTTGPRPVVNMWWVHTAKPMKAMRMLASTITG